MNAKEAKRLTLETMRKKRPMIEGFIQLIKKEIEEAIACEEFSFPLEKLTFEMTPEEFSLVKFFLESEGYEINNKYYGCSGKDYKSYDISWGQEDVSE